MLLEGEICYLDEKGSTLTKLEKLDVALLEEVKDSWLSV